MNTVKEIVKGECPYCQEEFVYEKGKDAKFNCDNCGISLSIENGKIYYDFTDEEYDSSKDDAWGEDCDYNY